MSLSMPIEEQARQIITTVLCAIGQEPPHKAVQDQLQLLRANVLDEAANLLLDEAAQMKPQNGTRGALRRCARRIQALKVEPLQDDDSDLFDGHSDL